jgi:hypothetical protein
MKIIEKLKGSSEKKEELVPVEFKKKKEKINKPKIKKQRFTRIKNFISANKVKLVFIKNLAIYSISYGIIINYMLWGVFGIKFSIFSFPAYGVLFHFLKEELPLVWAKFFNRDR